MKFKGRYVCDWCGEGCGPADIYWSPPHSCGQQECERETRAELKAEYEERCREVELEVFGGYR